MSNFTGSYTLDPTHTVIGFVARHAMVTKVRGKFNEWDAKIEIAETPAEDPIAEEVTEETETDKRLIEMLDTITELSNRLSALEGKLTEMEERLSKVEGQPAAEPIEDENKPAEEEVKASRLSYLKKK